MIIKIKQEWSRVLAQHESKVANIQNVTNNLIESGLTVSHGDIKDLINNGSALYEQAEQVAKSNAGIFKLPGARRRFIEENTVELRKAVDDAKQELIRVLNIHGSNPLTIDAYSTVKGQISISEEWKAELKEAYTVYESPERTEALRLMNEAKTAINNLNAFVSNNPHFGAGITSSQDGRRSLLWISGDGVLHEDIDNLEFI